MTPRPQRPSLFPYTTLFRSVEVQRLLAQPVAGEEQALGGCVPDGEGELATQAVHALRAPLLVGDRKSTRLNSSHVKTSYAVFCLKKKKSRPAETTTRERARY